MGIANFTNTGNTFLPGSWVDHLTSYGGLLDTFANSQTPATAWLRAGADGSSGAMAEPYVISSKFPHAHIHTHLRAGASLAEAFWQSINYPAEIICLGDPLLQPHADFPVVTLTAPTAGASASGALAINATAAPTGSKSLEPDLDLFVDGRRITVGLAGETVAATRTVGGFSLNTATIADGWHELRVVAYNNDSVRTQGEAVTTIHVNNSGRSLALTGPATINPDGSGNFTVTPTGLGDLTSLALQANGRTLGSVPVSGGTASVNGTLAPLANQWSVYAVGTRSNGQQVWSAPFTTTVNWPAQAAAASPSLGSAWADVRYFNSTTVSGFNWDSTPPDVVTTFSGNSTDGLSITSANVPGITFNGTTSATLKPGYELKLWFYAPVDDWYEVGFQYSNSGYFQSSACLLDGQSLTGRDFVFGPRRLAPGWHSLVLRTAVVNTAWSSSSWKILLRGGASQDFTVFTRATVASSGTGNATTTPVILSVTPSASPVTGTTVTLTANATLNGGTSGITYNWAQLGGPKSVAFSNNSSTTNSTTVTFSQAGNYTIGLLASSATDSASTAVPVTVNSTPGTLVLSTGGVTRTLRGLPLDVSAYSKDQFGMRMPVTPTIPGQPTVQWTTTDPSGSFVNVSASGETAQFRSLSAVSANQTFTVTATGINGRNGTATSPAITIVTNQPPTFSGASPFTITQDANTKQLVFSAASSDFETNSSNPTYPYSLLTYHWSVIGTPGGATLALGSDGESKITGNASGTGTYTLQLVVTDQAGQATTVEQSFVVDASGNLLAKATRPNFDNQTVNAGKNAYFSYTFVQAPGGVTYQFQTSSDGGATWQNWGGLQTFEKDGASWTMLFYGPVTVADNGRQVRLVVTNAGGSSIGTPATLTVNDPTSGTIDISVDNFPDLTGLYNFIPENAGNLTFRLRRVGQSNSALSVNWSVPAGTASQGSDYLGPNGSPATYNGTLTWADGESGERLLSVPIVDDALAEGDESFTVSISLSTGGTLASLDFTIRDNDSPGSAGFRNFAPVVQENAGSVSVPVQRLNSFVGPLTVNYTITSISAVAGQDFDGTSGSITWADGETADKNIVLPILSDALVEGDETFTVKLDSSPTWATVTIQDAPYQKWQQQWWPSALPTLPVFNEHVTAVRSFSPLFHFRFSETAGTTVAGVDAAGATVATGNLTKTASGNFSLAQPGPRPSAWPGLESGNTAVGFTAATNNSTTLLHYKDGGYVACGTANGIGGKLGAGFTLTGFVKTAVTDHAMTIVGGNRTAGNSTLFEVNLNQAYGNNSTTVPHSLRVFMKPVGGQSLEYSVTLANLPTGSLCDGQWHHIAITVPKFNYANYADYARFYFDGTEAALTARGVETIPFAATFAEFSDNGLRIGCNGNSAPDYFFSGSLDEIAFFPRVLNPAEIASIATARPPAAPPAYTSDGANPTGDSIPNLMKYALGLNPNLALSRTAGLPTFSANGTTLGFAFTRLRDASDITYRVERSFNLSSWSETWSSATDPYIGTDPTTTELIESANTWPKVFFRLRITRP